MANRIAGGRANDEDGHARVHQLIEQFERSNSELISFVERCPAAEWQATGHHRVEGQPFPLAWSEKLFCAHESWSVGLAMHHIAEDEALILDWVQLLAAGQPHRMILRLIDEIQAQHADQHARAAAPISTETVASLLRRSGAEVVSVLRGLSDEELKTTAPHPVWETESVSGEDIVEHLLIGHIDLHRHAIRDALHI